jgi:hypothetical protein
MLRSIGEFNSHSEKVVQGLNLPNLRQYFLTKASLARNLNQAYYSVIGLRGLVGESHNAQPFLQVSEKDTI